MRLATKEIIYKIDKLSEKAGIESAILMENAGKNAAQEISNSISEKKDVLIVCGKGHNGGDGYVIARHLKRMGFDVSIYPYNIPKKGNDPTYLNYRICKNIGIDFIKDLSKKFDVIIDSILGIGLKLPLKEQLQSLLDILNKKNAFKIAIDIPTGLDSNTGIVGKYAFKSDLTITMELPKIGMYITPGNLFCGDIKVSDIGIPSSIYSNIKFNNYAIDKNLAKYLLPKRSDNSHKGSFGKILLIGGSKSYPGAIMLSSKSAVKSGAGLVYSAFPESLSRTISSYIPDTIKIPLKETEEGSIDLSNFKKIIDVSNDMDAVLIGPGISDNKVTLNFVEMIVGEIDKPIILDADGLRILYNNSISIKTDKLLITPHPGEAARVLGINADEINTKRLNFARLLSDKFKCTVLLKGYKSIITNGNETYINLSGNSALARGGSGDILSGIITAFMGNGMDILNAASLGSYLHGLTGEIASENLSKYSISMDELIAIIPEAFKCICCN